MESYPRFDRSELDAKEKIKSLKKPFVDLFIKLKEKIDPGVFDGIVSDDTGARIPTLIFRGVYKKLTNQNPDILFVATGQTYYPKTEDERRHLDEYLQSGLGAAKKVVFVTQYIHSGDTVERLVAQLNMAGYDSVSVVALDALTRDYLTDIGIDLTATRSYSDSQHNMAERHMLVSDITKKKSSYSPMPMRLDAAIEQGEIKKSDIVYREEYDEFTHTNPRQFKNGDEVTKAFDEHHDSVMVLDQVPLSEDEKIAIQKNINFTRALISEVVDEIVSELYAQEVYSPKK